MALSWHCHRIVIVSTASKRGEQRTTGRGANTTAECEQEGPDGYDQGPELSSSKGGIRRDSESGRWQKGVLAAAQRQRKSGEGSKRAERESRRAGGSTHDHRGNEKERANGSERAGRSRVGALSGR
jgi:hypothetical protein